MKTASNEMSKSVESDDIMESHSNAPELCAELLGKGEARPIGSE